MTATKRVQFHEIPELNGFVSPRCGFRFDVSENNLRIRRPDGQAFESYALVVRRADEERRRADEERRRADEERRRAERLSERLRASASTPKRSRPPGDHPGGQATTTDDSGGREPGVRPG